MPSKKPKQPHAENAAEAPLNCEKIVGLIFSLSEDGKLTGVPIEGDLSFAALQTHDARFLRAMARLILTWIAKQKDDKKSHREMMKYANLEIPPDELDRQHKRSRRNTKKIRSGQYLSRSTIFDIEMLPEWVGVKVFAQFAGYHPNTTLQMIHQNVLPHRVINPLAKRKTYLLPKWALKQLLGIEDDEPKYVSKLLRGYL